MFFRKIILVSLALVAISAGAHAAPIDEVLPFAGDEWDEVPEIVNLPSADLRDEFLPIVARFLIYGMASAAFVIFFVAGAWLVLGWGEEDSTKKAKLAIIWAVVGIAFAAVSYLLVKGVVDLDFGWSSDEEGEFEKCEEGDVKNCVDLAGEIYESGEAICSESGEWDFGDCEEIDPDSVDNETWEE